MIHFIVGPNTFRSQELIAELERSFPANAIVRKDGSELTIPQLPDLLQGMSLFATERLVIIKELSSNKAVWEAFTEWIGSLSSEIVLAIVETNPDKRTKTYKSLQKAGKIVLCEELNEIQAVEWVKNEAEKKSGSLSAPSARLLVELVGTDQWRLSHELEKLLLVDDTSEEKIRQTIEPTPQASAFALLDAALAGKVGEMKSLLRNCEATEDPFRLFGLLVNQVYQLAVVSVSEGRAAEAIAKDIGAHPYPIKKMQAVSRRLSKDQVNGAVSAIAQLDDQLKRTVADPWVLLERALIKITTI